MQRHCRIFRLGYNFGPHSLCAGHSLYGFFRNDCLSDFVDCHAGIQKKIILQMRFELYWEEKNDKSQRTVLWLLLYDNQRAVPFRVAELESVIRT